MENKKDHINVCIRIKPYLGPESQKASLEVISEDPAVLVLPERSQTYQFDRIFAEDSDQAFVYDKAVKPFVDCVKDGFNCTVFTYGQTGTGKTYTMGSASQVCKDPSDTGIIPRALDQLFEDKFQDEDMEIEVFISFLEIYNEKVFDLLQPSIRPLPVSGFVVQGLSFKSVINSAEAKEYLEQGNKNRHFGETKQNLSSSRSHAIFTVYYTMRNSIKEITGRLNLVDLAGSESVRKTGSQGSTFHEGININKGLLCLGQVISALSTKRSYIPYRQSMITSILQGSLNSENYISLIACISANPEDITETIQTLDFAKRTKQVRCNPEVVQIVAKYKKENPLLFGSSRTPLKRPNSTPGKTPAVKRMCLPSLPLIDESLQSQISNTDGSQSSHYSSRQLLSIDQSSTSNSSNMTEQALSPIIKKYMAKIELSLRNHLETVVLNTIRRPTRASLLAQGSRGEESKENTPNMRWSKIQSEVSKMVQSEMAQITATKRITATSSPIENREKVTARRLWSPEDQGDRNNTVAIAETPSEINDFSFKVPQLPKGVKCIKRPSILTISPIENDAPKVTPRRSVRLSLKVGDNMESCDDRSMSFQSTLIGEKSGVHRRANMGKSMKNKNMIKSEELSFNSDAAQVKKFDQSQRRSVRLSTMKANNDTLMLSDSSDFEEPPLKRKKTQGRKTINRINTRSHNSCDSPFTANTKRILRVLNKGGQKDVEKLHSVGPKTAEQILLFRQLKGTFSEIEDLARLPGWGLKKYQKFASLNFLSRD